MGPRLGRGQKIEWGAKVPVHFRFPRRSTVQLIPTLRRAVLGRLPTDSERRLTLANVGKAPDKPAAWWEVLAALEGTEEARKYAEERKGK